MPGLCSDATPENPPADGASRRFFAAPAPAAEPRQLLAHLRSGATCSGAARSMRRSSRSSRRVCSPADVGVEATEHILEDLRRRVARNELADVAALIAALRASIVEILSARARTRWRSMPEQRPFVILVVGVNGSGKTTTIGKLARALPGAGPQRAAGRRRHLPRRGDRAAEGVGRALRRRLRRAAAGRRSGRGGVRCAAGRARARQSTCCSPTPPAACTASRT